MKNLETIKKHLNYLSLLYEEHDKLSKGEIVSTMISSEEADKIANVLICLIRNFYPDYIDLLPQEVSKKYSEMFKKRVF